ncbi:hypothetical protein DFH08DRAFT_1022107 [Mycena albidolilacea]|uniref:Uncharacterized protein n=1 Tax=Mycena albidolilacea TaxID=1033008 RepID=A0AAD6ZNE5_9AGAR|nr:hypothetical protein DFH08DRAFT_1022107 [Mycena albidolilacea]
MSLPRLEGTSGKSGPPQESNMFAERNLLIILYSLQCKKKISLTSRSSGFQGARRGVQRPVHERNCCMVQQRAAGREKLLENDRARRVLLGGIKILNLTGGIQVQGRIYHTTNPARSYGLSAPLANGIDLSVLRLEDHDADVLQVLTTASAPSVLYCFPRGNVGEEMRRPVGQMAMLFRPSVALEACGLIQPATSAIRYLTPGLEALVVLLQENIGKKLLERYGVPQLALELRVVVIVCSDYHEDRDFTAKRKSQEIDSLNCCTPELDEDDDGSEDEIDEDDEDASEDEWVSGVEMVIALRRLLRYIRHLLHHFQFRCLYPHDAHSLGLEYIFACCISCDLNLQHPVRNLLGRYFRRLILRGHPFAVLPPLTWSSSMNPGTVSISFLGIGDAKGNRQIGVYL